MSKCCPFQPWRHTLPSPTPPEPCIQDNCSLWFGDNEKGECSFKSLAISARRLEPLMVLASPERTRIEADITPAGIKQILKALEAAMKVGTFMPSAQPPGSGIRIDNLVDRPEFPPDSPTDNRDRECRSTLVSQEPISDEKKTELAKKIFEADIKADAKMIEGVIGGDAAQAAENWTKAVKATAGLTQIDLENQGRKP